eukprot:3314599-Prymnesium_polylepis.1
MSLPSPREYEHATPSCTMMLLMMNHLLILLSAPSGHTNVCTTCSGSCSMAARQGSERSRQITGTLPARARRSQPRSTWPSRSISTRSDANPTCPASRARRSGLPDLHHPASSCLPRPCEFNGEFGTISSPTVAAPPPPAMAAVGAVHERTHASCSAMCDTTCQNRPPPLRATHAVAAAAAADVLPPTPAPNHAGKRRKHRQFSTAGARAGRPCLCPTP